MMWLLQKRTSKTTAAKKQRKNGQVGVETKPVSFQEVTQTGGVVCLDKALLDHTYTKKNCIKSSQENEPSVSGVLANEPVGSSSPTEDFWSSSSDEISSLAGHQYSVFTDAEGLRNGSTSEILNSGTLLNHSMSTFEADVDLSSDEPIKSTVNGTDSLPASFEELPSDSALASGTLECICGSDEGSKVRSHVVQCQKCGTRQHASCVNYDLTDAYRGCYLCPHCLVAEVRICYKCLFIIVIIRGVVAQC